MRKRLKKKLNFKQMISFVYFETQDAGFNMLFKVNQSHLLQKMYQE